MKIRSYGKSELAMLYFPDSTPHVALNCLNARISRCRDLHDALQRCHLSPRAKFYSAQAVRLIVEYLGSRRRKGKSI